ncbi:MAG: UDP-3-O-(3-hydroxymyristoyl)glucosamine N-acyltransferase, partial [Planctomycetales bacterium]
PEEISFVDNPRAAKDALAKSQASALIVPSGSSWEDDRPIIEVDDVHAAFRAIYLRFYPRRPRKRIGISPDARVHSGASVADSADVYPGAYLGDEVVVGEDCVIHPGACVMEGCRLGDRTVIHPNAVLRENTVVGSDCVVGSTVVLGGCGFGYHQAGGRHELTPQLGWVEIGDFVELGSGTTVDCGTYGPTVIGEGTKIDNLVMIAHNCRIGKHNLICAQVGVAGSATTGDYVVVAGQVGIRDHIHIGNQATLGAMAGVMNNVPDGECWVGLPAVPDRDAKIRHIHLTKLPEMRKQFKALHHTVKRLEARLESDKKAG